MKNYLIIGLLLLLIGCDKDDNFKPAGESNDTKYIIRLLDNLNYFKSKAMKLNAFNLLLLLSIPLIFIGCEKDTDNSESSSPVNAIDYYKNDTAWVEVIVKANIESWTAMGNGWCDLAMNYNVSEIGLPLNE